MNKLLIIIPNVNKAGGTERAGINLANMLCDDYAITILSLEECGIPFFKVNEKVTIIYANIGSIPLGIKQKLNYFYTLYRYLRNFLKRNNFKFILGLGHNINSVLAFFKDNNTTVIGCEHINFEAIPKASKRIMRLVYPKLNAVVVLSELAKNKLKNLNENIYVIPNALPFSTDKVSKLDSNRIIIVGRLSEEKGYERIVPIAKCLKQKFPEWRIDIFGEGELYTDLINLYQKNEITNVFINPISKNIMNEYLNSSILLSTSYTEAMPMVFLEAMSCGVPVVSYRHEGAESLIIDSINGFIADNEREMIDKLQKLINNEEIMKFTSTNALKKGKEFGKDEVYLKWLDCLNKLNV